MEFPTTQAISVSELTSHIKRYLEDGFSDILLMGELSNFKDHVSGHWYFTLKDSGAQISGTMWRGNNASVFFKPVDGMKVIVQGKITVYPPRGNYQLDVRKMLPSGVGELQLAFDKLKEKLEREGLFEESRKRELPLIPAKIGIVTAPGGAAIRDMFSIAQRRFPVAEIIVAPCLVQGEGAATSIVEAINQLNRIDDIDVVIVGRGGGSVEDLWAFNEEIVARAIAKCKHPVVSAVGHEVDYTIADYVADFRAPTPSAAMEIITPDKKKLLQSLNDTNIALGESVSWIFSNLRERLSGFVNSYGFKSIESRIRFEEQKLDSMSQQMINRIETKLRSAKSSLLLLQAGVKSFDIAKIQKKGFVLVEQGNKFVSSSKQFLKGRPFLLKFHDGEIKVSDE